MYEYYYHYYITFFEQGKSYLFNMAVEISKKNTSTTIFHHDPVFDSYHIVRPNLSDVHSLIPYIHTLAYESVVQLSAFIAESVSNTASYM